MFQLAARTLRIGGGLSTASLEKEARVGLAGGKLARSSVHQNPSSKSRCALTILEISGGISNDLSRKSFIFRRTASGDVIGVCACLGEIEARRHSADKL
jgi:hypothetical protein